MVWSLIKQIHSVVVIDRFHYTEISIQNCQHFTACQHTPIPLVVPLVWIYTLIFCSMDNSTSFWTEMWTVYILAILMILRNCPRMVHDMCHIQDCLHCPGLIWYPKLSTLSNPSLHPYLINKTVQTLCIVAKWFMFNSWKKKQ